MWVEVLDADPDEGADAYDEALSVMEVMREEIAHLRRESERKDAIIMRLSESNAEQARTIREIEAPESREAGAYGPAEAGEGTTIIVRDLMALSRRKHECSANE